MQEGKKPSVDCIFSTSKTPAAVCLQPGMPYIVKRVKANRAVIAESLLGARSAHEMVF